MSQHLQARNLTKYYPPATTALTDVSFTVTPAAITALLGMNGAGKSTIVNIFSGVEQPSDGIILLDGAAIKLAGPAGAENARIGVVHQELPLLDALSAAENMLVGREHRLGQRALSLPARRSLLEQYAALARSFSGAPRGNALVGGLPLRQRQIVAIIRALWGDAQYIFFDEPSTSLDVTNRLALRATLNELTRRGVGLVYVTHFLDEALAIAQHIVVLRDGQVVMEKPTTETSMRSVITAMTGSNDDAFLVDPSKISVSESLSPLHDKGKRASDELGEWLLEVDGFETSAIGPISLKAHAREIVGVYGTEGCGAEEFLQGLAGLISHDGAVKRDGEPVGSGVERRLKAGIVLVTGDRKTMLVSEWSVRDNLSMADIAGSKWWKKPSGLGSAATAQVLHRLRIKGSASDAASSLSGGNQQKLVLGRLAGDHAAICLAIDPTRGIDIAARTEVQRLLQDIADAGAAIVVSSTDPQEVASIANRVLIFQNGKVVDQLVGDDITAENLEIRSLEP